MLGQFLILFTPALARQPEAYRDAEAFNRSTENRSLAWHLLKFPQFLLWSIWGSEIMIYKLIYGNYPLLLITASLAIAFLAFEFALNFWRSKL